MAFILCQFLLKNGTSLRGGRPKEHTMSRSLVKNYVITIFFQLQMAITTQW